MPANLPLARLAFLRLIAALLLAMVGVHAAVPTAQPLQVTHGSAFSADTQEVALTSRRGAEQASVAQTPQPLFRAQPPVQAELPIEAFARADPRPRSTAPPQN